MTPTGYNRRSVLMLAASGIAGACGKRADNSKENGKEVSKAVTAPKDGVVVNELQLDYSILLANQNSTSPVNEKFPFHNGDRFRFRFRPRFEAHVYLLNRGSREKAYSFLYPQDELKQDNPVPANGEIIIPGASKDWLQMDKATGTEQIVLIASPSQLVEFNVPAKSIERDEFEERIGRVERDYRPASSRRLENGGVVSLFASRGPKTAVVIRLPLDHRS